MTKPQRRAQRRIDRRLRKIERPTDATSLIRALQTLFSDFQDEEIEQDLMSGELSMHGVMREFRSCAALAQATEAQLQGLAELLSVCVAQDDDVENAVATCFLEHLRRRDALWAHLPSSVRRHARA